MIEKFCKTDIKIFEFTSEYDKMNLVLHSDFYTFFPSYIKYLGEKALCAGGIVPVEEGVFTTWSIVSEYGKKHPIATVKNLIIGFNLCKAYTVTHYKVHRIQAITLPNDFAFKLDLKLGFKFEGILKSYFGKDLDAYIMGMEIDG